LNNEYNHLYNIQAHGDKIPVFGIFCEQLFLDKKNILSSRPIYDFVWPGADGRSFEMHSVEEISQAYLKQILKTNPSGPYYLMGFSFGGLVAFEIAVELQKRGLQVPILMLIDSGNPNARVSNVIRYEKTIKDYGFFKSMKRWIFSSIPRHIKNGTKRVRIYLILKSNKSLPADLTNLNILTNAFKIASKYHPRFYNGKIHLFQIKNNGLRDHFLGWKNHVSEIQQFELDGNHGEAVRLDSNKNLVIRELEKAFGEVER
jgi:thioesterase domain-containing protein